MINIQHGSTACRISLPYTNAFGGYMEKRTIVKILGVKRKASYLIGVINSTHIIHYRDQPGNSCAGFVTGNMIKEHYETH